MAFNRNGARINASGSMGKGGTIHLMSPATAVATAIAGYITNSGLYKVCV